MAKKKAKPKEEKTYTLVLDMGKIGAATVSGAMNLIAVVLLVIPFGLNPNLVRWAAVVIILADLILLERHIIMFDRRGNDDEEEDDDEDKS